MRSEAGQRPPSWCASDPVSSETSHRAEMPCALSPACLTPNRQALGVVCTYRPTHGDRSRWTRAHQICRSSCEPLLGHGLLDAECRGRVAISRCAHINTLETRQCQDSFCDRIIRISSDGVDISRPGHSRLNDATPSRYSCEHWETHSQSIRDLSFLPDPPNPSIASTPDIPILSSTPRTSPPAIP